MVVFTNPWRFTKMNVQRFYPPCRRIALLVLCLLTIISQCGCSNNSSQSQQNPSEISASSFPEFSDAQIADQVYYKAEPCIYSEIWDYTVVHDEIFLIEAVDEGFNVSSVSEQENPVLYHTSDSYLLWLAGGNDTLCIVSSTFVDNKEIFSLIIMDTTGKQQKVIELNSVISEAITSIYGLKMDGTGNIYVLADQKVYSFSSQGDFRGHLSIHGEVTEQIAVSNNGKIILLSYIDGSFMLESVSDNTETQVLFDVGYDFSLLNDGFGDYQFCVSQTDGYYGYDTTTGQLVKLIDWDVLEFDSTPAVSVQENSFICVSLNKMYKLYPLDEPPEYTTLHLAVLNGSGGINLSTAIHNYEKNTDTRIEICNYSTNEAQTQLKIQLASGDGPDLFDFAGKDIYSYVQTDYLVQLNNLLETDSELHREDIIAIESTAINGNLYFLPMSFTIDTYIGSKNIWGNSVGWTYADCKEILQQHPDVLPYSKNNFVTYSISDFLNKSRDEQNNTFNYSDLQNILEIANMLPVQSQDTSGEFRGLWIDSFASYVDFIENNEYMTVIGWPSQDGNYSVEAVFSTCTAISSTTVNLDIAWDFLKSTICGEVPGSGLPCYRPYLEQQIQSALDPQSRFNGMTIEIVEGGIDGQDAFYADDQLHLGDLNNLTPSATPEQAASFWDVLNHIGSYNRYESTIASIITEEAQPYFNGDKKIEDVLEVIENRIKIYISEQS